ncbi:MAG: hypothetical protein KC466_10760, partial [Myxococcales bacterium]|nr:hypothetical protein [Myxococcales bacterium]
MSQPPDQTRGGGALLPPERPTWEHQDRVWICGLRASSRAFYLNRWFGAAEAPTLVVAEGMAEARRLTEDLAFFGGPGSAALYPAWEALPFDLTSPPTALTTARMEALWAVHAGAARFLVAPVDALLKRTLRPEDFARHTLRIAVTGTLDLDEAATRLGAMGYRSTPMVEDRGEFSIRGGILDIFPPGRESPVRVDLFGDQIEAIRSFDVVDQRSQDELERLEILPARELLLSPETLPAARERIRDRADALDIGRVARQRLIDELEAGILGPGCEWLLPFFFAPLGDVFDYLKPGSIIAIDDSLGFEAALDRAGTRVEDGAAFALARKHLFPEPEDLFHDTEGLRARINEFRRLQFESVEIHSEERSGATLSLACETHEELRGRLKELKGDDHHLQPLADAIGRWREDGLRTVLVCHTDSQAERLRELLEDYELYPTLVHPRHWGPEPAGSLPHLGVAVGALNEGFVLRDRRLAIVAEEEIFGQRVRPRRARRVRDFIASIQDIHTGDYVVHVDHGIGRYVGLDRKHIGDEEEDFLALEYAGGDRLFVPVQKINLVQRYVGADEAPPKLTKLGGTVWEKAKSRARKAVEDMTDELVDLYAKRAVAHRKAYPPADHHFREFEASFGYEETPDQAAAIDDVLGDLCGERPMDRLVCGDVGYG